MTNDNSPFAEALRQVRDALSKTDREGPTFEVNGRALRKLVIAWVKAKIAWDKRPPASEVPADAYQLPLGLLHMLEQQVRDENDERDRKVYLEVMGPLIEVGLSDGLALRLVEESIRNSSPLRQSPITQAA